MRLRSWLSTLSRPRPVRRARPAVEVLEARDVPATGGLDLSFSTDGRFVTGFTNNALDDSAAAVAVQPDGKIVVVGSATNAGGNVQFFIVRLNRDGSQDSDFSGGGKTVVAFELVSNGEDRATCVAIQPDGKILVGGFAESSDGNDFAVCRLNPDGFLDTTFDDDGRATVDIGNDDRAFDLALSGKKIVLAGVAGFEDDEFAVVRLKADGSPDDTFGIGGEQTVSFEVAGTLDDVCTAVAVLESGKIVLGGTAAASTSSDTLFAFARLTTAGQLDSTFGSGDGKFTCNPGVVTDFQALEDLAVQPDGKIVAVGSLEVAGDHDFLAIRVLADGSNFDTGFGNNGRAFVALDVGGSDDDDATAVALQPDGKILLTGTAADSTVGRVGAARLLPDGTPDPFFGTNGEANQVFNASSTADNQVLGMALTPEGIVVVGRTVESGLSGQVAVARLVRDQWVVVSADKGGPPTVKVFTPTGTLLRQFKAFPSTFKGGVQVALGDITGDSVPDLFCAPGAGRPADVRIYDGLTQTLIRTTRVFPMPYKGGVNLAVGNVSPDSGLELVVARRSGTSPLFHVFNAAGDEVANFAAFDAPVQNGLRVSIGEISPAGLAEVLVSAAGSSDVRSFNVEDSVGGPLFTVPGETPAAGFFVAVASVIAGGNDEVIVGPASGPAVVRLMSPINGSEIRQVTPFPETFTTGVRLGSLTLDSDGVSELLVAGGKGHPEVRVIDLSDGDAVLASFKPFAPSVTAGLFVVGGVR